VVVEAAAQISAHIMHLGYVRLKDWQHLAILPFLDLLGLDDAGNAQ